VFGSFRVFCGGDRWESFTTGVVPLGGSENGVETSNELTFGFDTSVPCTIDPTFVDYFQTNSFDLQLWYIEEVTFDMLDKGATITSGSKPSIIKGARRVAVARCPLQAVLATGGGTYGNFPFKVQTNEEEEENVGHITIALKLIEFGGEEELHTWLAHIPDESITRKSNSLRYPNLSNEKEAEKFRTRVADEMLLKEYVTILGHSALTNKGEARGKVDKILHSYQENQFDFLGLKSRLQGIGWKYGSTVPGDVLTQCCKFLVASGHLDPDLYEGVFLCASGDEVRGRKMFGSAFSVKTDRRNLREAMEVFYENENSEELIGRVVSIVYGWYVASVALAVRKTNKLGV